jgi:hypothetical protein
MGRFLVLMFGIACLTISQSFSQTSLIDSTKFDKVGDKKNGFFIEALGSSYIAGIFYQRTIPLAQKKLHLRFTGGFSPFAFGNVSFSSGVSLPTGVGLYFFKSRFKLGVTMMLIHGLYFEPVTVVDAGSGPDVERGYQLFLQPQLNFEYHFSQRFVGRAAFTPTFIPGINNSVNTYSFYPWGGLVFGYKF